MKEEEAGEMGCFFFLLLVRERERERDRERDIDLMLHLFTHSLVDSRRCPDRGLNL